MQFFLVCNFYKLVIFIFICLGVFPKWALPKVEKKNLIYSPFGFNSYSPLDLSMVLAGLNSYNKIVSVLSLYTEP